MALLARKPAVGGAERTFGVTAEPFSPDLQINAVSFGTKAISKTGDGELSFNAASTSSGAGALTYGGNTANPISGFPRRT